MNIKKYVADTLKEAMAMARRELGEDALILSTREIQTSSAGAFKGRSRVELVATTGEGAEAYAGAASRSHGNGSAGEVRPPEDYTPYRPEPLTGAETSGVDTPGIAEVSISHQLQSLSSSLPTGKDPAEELESLKAALRSLLQGGALASAASSGTARGRGSSLAGRLVAEGICPALAEQVEDAVLAGASPGELGDRFSSLFRCSPPLDPKGRSVLALVGGPGSGKTTTLAKIAATYKFRYGSSVAIIGCDNHRVGGIEELRTLAQVIGCPSEYCFDSRDLALAIRTLSANHNVVLVDTFGCSPRNREGLRELQELLKGQALQRHLVVPASLSIDSRLDLVETFSEMGASAQIVSKVDEATNRLPVLALSQESQLPFSFITEGQDIPGQVTQAVPARLAQFVLSDAIRLACPAGMKAA